MLVRVQDGDLEQLFVDRVDYSALEPHAKSAEVALDVILEETSENLENAERPQVNYKFLGAVI